MTYGKVVKAPQVIFCANISISDVTISFARVPGAPSDTALTHMTYLM